MKLIIKIMITNAHRTTEHTHCGSKPIWKFSLPCTERGVYLPSKCCAFVRIGSYSVTALAVKWAFLLGDMPKRHVGYALTLGDISGLMIAINRLVLLDFELV